MSDLTALRCSRHHDHVLAWNNHVPGGPIWKAVETALAHARPLIEEGFVDSPEDYARYLETADLLVQQAKQEAPARNLMVSDDTARESCEALMVGVEYMFNNHYDEDTDFPEDAWAAQTLGGDGGFATTCYTPEGQ